MHKLLPQQVHIEHQRQDVVPALVHIRVVVEQQQAGDCQNVQVYPGLPVLDDSAEILFGNPDVDLDYSVAKGGKLVAYRYQGESYILYAGHLRTIINKGYAEASTV